MPDDMFLFVDRTEAGEQLAGVLLTEPLIQETPRDKLLVLSIPRGGVIVGAAVAQGLECAHEVAVVKKIGFPGHEEMAIGAMTEDGMLVLNKDVVVSPKLHDYIEQQEKQIKAKIKAYVQKFHQGRQSCLKSKTVILVDDGIATGETMKAAVIGLLSKDKTQHPGKVLVAVPVCSPPAARELSMLADKLVCLAVPEQFWAVGQFYWDFDQISDEEVLEYLVQTDSNECKANDLAGK